MRGNYKHGHAIGGITKTYQSWASMVARCTNSRRKDFVRYGGRGITICEEWFEFKNFLKDMGEKPVNCSLDRTDNSKGYSKENCRWATISEQVRNKRNNVWVTFNGETLCISDWARKSGIPRLAITRRLKAKWPLEKALTLVPVKGRNQYNPPIKQALQG